MVLTGNSNVNVQIECRGVSVNAALKSSTLDLSHCHAANIIRHLFGNKKLNNK